ncbi:MAG: TonB-dependent receptor [Fidelibacterota bacterium]
MNTITKLFIFIVLLTGMAFGYIDTLDVYYFDQVVVTGTRTATKLDELPQTISVLNPTLLRDQHQQPLLNIISDNIPGLFVSNKTNAGYGLGSGSGGNITMRGVGAFPNTQVLVMIDGRPDVMGLFGHPLGDSYMANNVEKVEVIRGPASVLYGSNAMGGVINIITKDVKDEGFNLQVPIKYSSFNTQNIGVTQSYGKGDFGYSISGGYKSSDGFRETGNDDYESLNLNLVSNYEINQNLKAKANIYMSDYEVWDPGQVTNPFVDHVFDIQRSGGDLTLAHNHGNLSGTFKLHHNRGHHEIQDGSDYESDDYMTGIILTETYNYAAGSNVTVGFDGRQLGGKAIVHDGWPDWKEKNITEISGLVNLHHLFMNRIIVESGVRYTNHSITGDEIIPALGTVFKLPQKWNLKLQYAKGYRNPTINEMYLFMPSTEKLEAEISETYEISVQKGIADWFRAAVTVYQTELTNLIEKTMPVPMQPLYQNVGKVEMQGIELESELLLPPAFSINLAYSYNDISKKISNSPEQKLNLGVRHNYQGKLFSRLNAQFISGLYSIENPYSYAPPVLKKTDHYFLLNFHTNYTLNEYLSFYGEIDNILDTEYEIMYGFPMPGRMFTIGVTASYR